jgi:hypothetical protein
MNTITCRVCGNPHNLTIIQIPGLLFFFPAELCAEIVCQGCTDWYQNTVKKCIYYNAGNPCMKQRPAIFAGKKPVICPCKNYKKEKWI